MADIYLEWKDDFKVSASGGLMLAEGNDYARQRLQRRLYTAERGYVWHPEYGAGLPQKIGSTYRATEIEAIVQSQVALEASVEPDPPPVVTVSRHPNQPDLTGINVRYTAADTGEAVSFSLAG